MDTEISGGQARDPRFAFRVGSSTVSRSVVSAANVNGKCVITDTGTVALPKDLVRFEAGAVYAFQEFNIVDSATNTFTLNMELNPLPAPGDTFFVLRYATQQVDDEGVQLVTITAAPVSFLLDGANTTVSEDTVTPANSKPLPIAQLDANGVRQSLATETTQVANGVLLGAVNEAAPATDTASSGLNGRLQRIAQRLTTLIAFFASNFGVSTGAIRTAAQVGNASGAADFNSGVVGAQTLRTALASDQLSTLATETTQAAGNTLLGAVNETAPATDTASSGLNGRLQRIAQRITSMIALLPASLGQKASASSFAVTLSSEQEAELGIVTETAPATDTASSGLNGRLQRIAQRLTSLIALLPASLGTKAAASSLATTWSTEDEALIGSLTETAPATDTASSGLNGRLQRIAQRLTSLIALFPTSLGQKAMASSFAVVIASDQSAIPITANSSVNVAQINGVTPLMGAGNTGTGSPRVTIATDQAAIATKAPVNANGSNTDSTVSTVKTETVPANAVGFILMNLDTSGANIRWRIGSAATSSTGQQLQVGRDTGYIPCAANISLCAESGTQNYNLQWILSA